VQRQNKSNLEKSVADVVWSRLVHHFLMNVEPRRRDICICSSYYDESVQVYCAVGKGLSHMGDGFRYATKIGPAWRTQYFKQQNSVLWSG